MELSRELKKITQDQLQTTKNANPKSENVYVAENRSFSYLDIPNIPDRIKKSETGRYYIVFDDNHKPKNIENLKEELAVFQINKLLLVTKSTYLDLNTRQKEEAQMLYYIDLGYAITALTEHQIKLIELQDNSFKILPEKLVVGVSCTHQPAKQENWGIEHMDIERTRYTGMGVNVAILDTGFDNSHPDFKDRIIKTHSFISEDSEDDNGHAMHCIGIAFGHKDYRGIRYGVAHNTNIFAGKILDENKKGTQNDLIEGIYWAIANECKVILLSLTIPNDGTKIPDVPTLKALKYGRENNCIVVAAAGNQSHRSRGLPYIFPLGSPADSQLAIAVSAIDHNHAIYEHSNHANIADGQQMNYTAPGVHIYSCWSTKGLPKETYRTATGTSMAAPFVAGIIALLWEKHAPCSYRKILDSLYNSSKMEQTWLQKDCGFGIPKIPLK